MKRQIGVFLGAAGRRIGTLRFDIQGPRTSAGFAYHTDWLTAADHFAIDPDLPLVAGMQFHRQQSGGSAFHSAVADTEPDGWGRQVILRDHAKRRQQAKRAGKTVGTAPLNAVDPDDGGRLMYVSAATLLGADDRDGTNHCYTGIVDALMSVAPYFRIDQVKARRMLGRVESAVSRWRVVGRKSA